MGAFPTSYGEQRGHTARKQYDIWVCPKSGSYSPEGDE